MAAMPPCPKCGGTIRAELSEIFMTDPVTGKRSTYLWVNHACPEPTEIPNEQGRADDLPG